MISEAEYRKKVLACWYGKNIGGTLGGPYEGFPVVNHLTFYDPVPTGSMPNDDLELQAMYAAALDRMEKPCVSREALADIWSKHMKFMCDEYAVAVRNLEMGLRPPWTGRFDNHFTCGMGAAIRSELWACLAPGNPGLAAKFAYEDACIDHDGAGVDAEVFNAVVESLAFVEPDVRKLTEAGLEYLPADSTLAAGIREAISLWDETHDWFHCRNVLFEKYASEAVTDVRINLPFTVLALLSGNGDFGKTICDAVNCGMDTDCTGATAGAILGILNPDGIPEEWMKPVGKELGQGPDAFFPIFRLPGAVFGEKPRFFRFRGRFPAAFLTFREKAARLRRPRLFPEKRRFRHRKSFPLPGLQPEPGLFRPALPEDGSPRRQNVGIGQPLGGVKGRRRPSLGLELLPGLPHRAAGQIEGIPHPPLAAHPAAFLHLGGRERPAFRLHPHPLKVQGEAPSFAAQHAGPVLRRAHAGSSLGEMPESCLSPPGAKRKLTVCSLTFPAA